MISRQLAPLGLGSLSCSILVVLNEIRERPGVILFCGVVLIKTEHPLPNAHGRT